MSVLLSPHVSNENKNCIIYALRNPPELGGDVKYIGLSTVGVSRAKAHYTETKRTVRNYKRNWITGLKAQGLRYDIEILEDLGLDCPLAKLAEREMFWITYHRSLGANLTNLTDGGLGAYGLRQEHKTRRMSPEAWKACRDAAGKKSAAKLIEFHKNNREYCKIASEKRVKTYVAINIFDITNRIIMRGTKEIVANGFNPRSLPKLLAEHIPHKDYIWYVEASLPSDTELQIVVDSVDKSGYRNLHKVIDGIECKACCICKDYKPLAEFGKYSKSWDKLYYRCRVCEAKTKASLKDKDNTQNK